MIRPKPIVLPDQRPLPGRPGRVGDLRDGGLRGAGLARRARRALFTALTALTGPLLLTAPPVLADTGSLPATAASPSSALPLSAPPPVDPAERLARCTVPTELEGDAEPLPGTARALRGKGNPVTIVVLGPQAAGGARQEPTGIIAYPPRLQAQLSAEWRELLGDRQLNIEVINQALGSTRELAALIPTKVVPLKPALVIWQVGRADARRGTPPSRFTAPVRDGAETLRKSNIDLILMDPRYHPQFEALYRTDDYRQHLRWLAGKRDLTLVRRFQMIEYWASEGRIDLDSGTVRAQRAAGEFIEDCLAYQVARLLSAGVALASPAPASR